MRWAILCLPLLLAGCDGPLSLLTGGGPNVAANVQAGRTNSQTLGSTEINDQRIVRPQARDIRQSSDENGVRSDIIETFNSNEGTTWWELLVMALLLLADSPKRWPGQIMAGLRRN